MNGKELGFKFVFVKRTIKFRSHSNTIDNPAIRHMIENSDRQFEARARWLKVNKPQWSSSSSRYDLLWEGKVSPKNQPLLSLSDRELQHLTWNYLGRNAHWNPAPNTTWRDYAAEAASNHVGEGLKHLHTLSLGKNEKALTAILDLATTATAMLTEAIERSASLLGQSHAVGFCGHFLRQKKKALGTITKSLLRKFN